MEASIMNHGESIVSRTRTTKRNAEVVAEYGPFGPGGIHGVTFDGALVWFARDGELVAFDPEKEEVVRRLAVPADAGTAFDGENLYQLAHGEILVVRPSDGRVLRKMPSPDGESSSGMAWADGFLWVGSWRNAKIHQVDAQTGDVVKTLTSDRWVTGVSCVDGAVWHATMTENKTEPAEIRRLAADGTVEASYVMPDGAFVSGLEAGAPGEFWCGGGGSGKLRRVRARPAKAG